MNYKSYEEKAIFHISNSEFTQAIDNFNKAIEINPKCETLYINRAFVKAFNVF